VRKRSSGLAARGGRVWTDLLLRVVVPLVVIAGLLLGYRFLWVGPRDRLVVYCTHDSIYSKQVLEEFEERSGIATSMVFDTEATKSLGLVERLIREKNAPRCDVFWNNELLGTMDLAERGMLLGYKGSGFARIPDAFKDPEGLWVGFAARMRVIIVNIAKMQPTEGAMSAALDGDLSRAAIAKPLYGTTLTHYAVLWDHWGAERLKSWHRDIRRRGIRELTGNATVKNLVAEGVCDFGFTDTDDYFDARDEGKPVTMFPVRLDDGRVISIPNSVCILKGSRRVEAAKKLVDYLLSEEVELVLADSKARQIPLGQVAGARLNADVRELKNWAEQGYPLPRLGKARTDCLVWLKSEYLK